MLRVQFVKLALFFAPLLLKDAGTSVVATPSSANAVPFSTIGDVAAVQNSGAGGFRMYSQNSDGDIVQTCVNGPFTIGSTSKSSCGKDSENFVVVPANETMYGTPIAVTGLQDTNDGPIHLYFYSPDRIISEYIRKSDFVWQSGPSCTQCITNEGFLAADGTNALYALGSTNASHALRVGFINAGAPQTMTEAVYDSTTGRWASAGLPN